MKQYNDSKDHLFDAARKQYQILCEYCSLLLEEGYWEQPESILKHSIFEMLDSMVQAVLIYQIQTCNRNYENELEFIQSITNQSLLDSMEDGTIPEETMMLVKKYLAAPPILIQLCSLRDMKHQSDVAGKFLDGIFNIMLAAAHLGNPKEDCVLRYMQDYYGKANVFLNLSNGICKFTPRYLFLKLSQVGFDECYALYEKYQEPVRGLSQPAIKENNESETAEESSQEIDFDYEKINVEEDSIMDNVSEEKKEDNLNERNRLEELLEELNGLIGLLDVKEEIRSLINLIKVKKMREAHQMPSMNMTYHMVFTGNPGTGKTTVARLVAQIYQELGILSKGTLVETDRAGLVAGYVGQTALKVKEVVDKAIGGVLFIDEAYSLTNHTVNNDFGLEAVDALVKLMEDHRDDLVVIVAGYKTEMNEFLHSNTGLISRFNKFIDFKDYSNLELLQIMEVFAEKSGVELDAEAKALVKQKISKMTKSRKQRFGNARGIRNCFEKIMVNQANRIVTFDKPTIEQLKQITSDDVDFSF